MTHSCIFKKNNKCIAQFISKEIFFFPETNLSLKNRSGKTIILQIIFFQEK